MRAVQVLMLIGALLALAGCSSASTPGQAASPPRPTYPEYLPDHARKDLTYLETLRPLDVCGFLDHQALAALGTANYFGADGTFESCTARFPKGKARHGISKVEVSMGGNNRNRWGPQIVVGGTPPGEKQLG
ncbi:hypothetical protein, partial [Nocardia sp. NPDC058497]|uniref:hypothetical protein n=1 Tax=Nocardia sp. NPDC058497 TaxID=3346529 RepID=UPI00365F3E35